MKELVLKEYKGVLLSFVLASAAWFASPFAPSWINSILLALLAGIFVGNLFKIPDTFSSGISFTSGKMLELSVVFLAFSINFSHIVILGWKSFAVLFFVVLIIILITFYFSKLFRDTSTTSYLIGFGTAICGSSAIAALSSAITKNKEDVGISMAVVNLFGTLGMIFMPLVFTYFALNPQQMGMLLGGTLHSVGNVAGAGYGISEEVGKAAIMVKMARVALLSPALLLFHFLVSKSGTEGNKISFSLPWYLWLFIGITILGSFISIPQKFTETTEWIGKIVLTLAMAAIGLKIGFKKLLESGKKGLLLGALIFIIQIVLVAGLMIISQSGSDMIIPK